MTMQLEAEPVVAAPPPPPAPAPTKAPRLGGVDGLRGLAALIVLVFHMFGQSGGPELRLLHRVNVLRPLHDGWAAVNLFLVLSGFCLYWPFATRPGKAERPLQLGEYARRRSVRILPTFYASLAFVVLLKLAIPGLSGDPQFMPGNWHNLISHLVLLNSWFPRDITGWNSVTWSLSLEWTWYATFPLALLLFRKVGATPGFLVLAAACVAYRVGLRLALGRIGNYHPGDVNYGFVWRTFVVGRLFEFGVGMYVAAWVAGGRAVPAWFTRFGLLLVLGLLVAGHLTTPVDGFVPVRDGLYGLASAALLLLVVAPGENLARRVMSLPAAVWLGQFSYTLYLFHLGLLAVASMGFHRMGFKDGSLTLFALMLATGPLVIVASWALYLVVERPFAVSKPKRQPVTPPDALISPVV